MAEEIYGVGAEGYGPFLFTEDRAEADRMVEGAREGCADKGVEWRLFGPYSAEEVVQLQETLGTEEHAAKLTELQERCQGATT